MKKEKHAKATTPESTTQPVQQPNEKQIMPVFIGCVDHKAMKSFIEAITNYEGEFKYEPVIMTPDVLEASVNNWYFMQLGSSEQQRLNNLKKDEVKRLQALERANELKDFFPLANGFKSYQLKNYYNNFRINPHTKKLDRANLSHKEVEEVINFLVVFKYLTPTILDANSKNQVYAVTVDNTSRLLHLQQLNQKVEQQRLELLDSQQVIEQEIALISNYLLNDVENVEPNAKPEATASTPNRVVNEYQVEEEQLVPGDALNDH